MANSEVRILNMCKNMIRYSELEAEKGNFYEALLILEDC